MKSRIMLGWLLLGMAGAGFAQMTPGKDASQPVPAAPAKPDAKKAPAKKKEEPPATVDGLAIPRAEGGFLGLQVVNGNFALTFYDAKKKKIPPDVTRAVLHWPSKYQQLDERTVLNPTGPNSLGSEKVVRPPLTFKLFISLYVEGKEDSVESYTIDYHGE